LTDFISFIFAYSMDFYRLPAVSFPVSDKESSESHQRLSLSRLSGDSLQGLGKELVFTMINALQEKRIAV